MPAKRHDQSTAEAVSHAPGATPVSRTPWLDTLRPKRRRFCEEYVKDNNATQAAIRAGYSETSARRHGHVLVHTPEVAHAIAELAVQRCAEGASMRVRVIDELARIAFANITDFCTWDESGLRLKAQLPANDPGGVGIAKVVHRRGKYGDAISVDMRNRMPALNALGKAAGLFDPRPTPPPPMPAPAGVVVVPAQATIEEWERLVTVERERIALERQKIELEERRQALERNRRSA